MGEDALLAALATEVDCTNSAVAAIVGPAAAVAVAVAILVVMVAAVVVVVVVVAVVVVIKVAVRVGVAATAAAAAAAAVVVVAAVLLLQVRGGDNCDVVVLSSMSLLPIMWLLWWCRRLSLSLCLSLFVFLLFVFWAVGCWLVFPFPLLSWLYNAATGGLGESFADSVILDSINTGRCFQQTLHDEHRCECRACHSVA